jgi:putative oxidoreductase
MRLSLGATMLQHGLPKLSAEGARQTGEMFEGLGFRPGSAWARAAGAAEVLGGVTALLGIGTRIGALAVIATQAVAIAKVHAGKGFSNMNGGWEFNVALVAMATALLVAGPGRLSVHEAVEHRLERRGLGRWLPLRLPVGPPRARAALAAAKALK